MCNAYNTDHVCTHGLSTEMRGENGVVDQIIYQNNMNRVKAKQVWCRWVCAHGKQQAWASLSTEWHESERLTSSQLSVTTPSCKRWMAHCLKQICWQLSTPSICFHNRGTGGKERGGLLHVVNCCVIYANVAVETKRIDFGMVGWI